jgi:tetratricopeptide (TPR) repeat protein
VLAELSTTYIWTDETALAEQTVRESIAIFDSTSPPMYPDRVHTEMTLAETLYLQNRLDEATSILVEALRKTTQLFGRNSVEVADALDRLAEVKRAQGRLGEAETYARDAFQTARIVYGDRHSLTATMAVSLGRILAERGKYSEAESTLRQSLTILIAELPPDHQYTASAEYFLGETLLATSKLDEAEKVLLSSMGRWRRSNAPTWRTMRSACALGETLYRQGRLQEGEKYLAESFYQLSKDNNADPTARAKARERFAQFVKNSRQTNSSPPKSSTILTH